RGCKSNEERRSRCSRSVLPGAFGEEDENAARPVESEIACMARVCEGSHGTRQARCTRRRGGEAIMGGEYANSIHQFRLGHGDGPSAVTPEHRNGERTRLAAGEHLRGCSEIAHHPNRATGRE